MPEKTITPEELAVYIQNADRITSTKGRKGTYLLIQEGLIFTTWFVGPDLVNEKLLIIEALGKTLPPGLEDWGNSENPALATK